MIELLGTGKKSSIKDRLTQSIKNCKSMKAAIAYWTILIDYIPELSYALAKEGSFVCVDIQLPTNIDALKIFKERNSNIFLHSYELTKSIEYQAKNENKLPALMHTKVIIFEFEDFVELWIGSHNFTRRALDGVNFELTSITTVFKDTSLHLQLETYLEFIKSHCIQFDVSEIDFYKSLQGEQDKDDWVDVIEFTGEQMKLLERDKTIQIISEDISNFEDYRLIGRTIILHGIELSTWDEYIFKAKIINAGSIDKTNEESYSMDFSARRYAIRKKNEWVQLQPAKEITKEDLKNAKYFVNIEIEKLLKHAYLYEKPNQIEENWNYELNTPHLNRMSESDKIALFNNSNKIIRKAEKKEKKKVRVSLKKLLKYEFEDTNIRYQAGIVDMEPLNPFKNLKKHQVLVKRILEDKSDEKTI